MEDFSGKSEFLLWSDDYVKFSNYLEKGKNLFITGYFKSRWGKENEFEFKVSTYNTTRKHQAIVNQAD
jgi:DNA polymerase-3 subunit alpha